MGKVCFGVDVGGTTVKLGLFTTDGDVLDKWEIITRTQNQGDFILSDIKESIEEKYSERKIQKEDILGIGIGVPGPVTDQGVIKKAVNLGWPEFSIVDKFQKMTGLPVKAANDANVAALGEMWKGGGQGYQNVVLVTLGTGVGGGIIINGKIINGVNGAGGEIGHMHVEDGVSDVCGCGKKGCLEQMASASGVVRLAMKKLNADKRPSLLRNNELSAKAVFDAVKEDDEIALEIVEDFGRYLGNALANIATIVDPEIFVIGGGVSKAGQILLDYIKKYYKIYAFPACKNVIFALAKLENDAGIYGAAKLLL